nr:DNA translocase FtsK [Vaginisenegalia massiliensis]
MVSFLATIGLFNWGMVGIIIANSFRLLVGQAYSLLLGTCLVFAVILCFKGHLFYLGFKRVIGGVLVLSAITTLLHFNAFSGIMATNANIFQLTFDSFKNEFLMNQTDANLGGGMLGACFFAAFGYLFGRWGTYLLVLILFTFGLLLLINANGQALLRAFASLGLNLQHVVRGLFPKIEEAREVFNRPDLSVEEQNYQPSIKKKEAKDKSESWFNRFFGNDYHYEAEPTDIVEHKSIIEPSYQPSLTSRPDKAWDRYSEDIPQASRAASVRQEGPVLDLDYFEQMNPVQATKRKEDASKPSAVTQSTEVFIPSANQIDAEFDQGQVINSEVNQSNRGDSAEDGQKMVPLESPQEMAHAKVGLPSAGHWQEQANQKQALTSDELDDLVEDKVSVIQSSPRAKKSSSYQLPSKALLKKIPPVDQSEEYQRINENIEKLERTFESFGVKAQVVKANLGPSVTKYEIEPAIGVKVSKIVSLSDDIALALAARDVRMEAPIPGKSLIGIEVPNTQVSPVSFWEIVDAALESPNLLEVPLGRDISGAVSLADLSKMPHLLIAGATGSGKSVGMNVIIVSLLMKARPDEVKFLMIDPKKVELTMYDGIPHMLTPVVTNPRKAAQALNKVVQEMERRYEVFAAMGVRNADSYNEQVEAYNAEEGTAYEKMPKIVVFVDELADLMMVASNEVENAIIRLAQMARAAGIHMIIATQRPSVDVITGIIKANVPSRLAFAVSSGTDSRTILDSNGAEKLLGRGDMLFQPMGKNKPVRVQGAYISDSEVEKITDFIKNQGPAEYDPTMMIDQETTEESVASDDEYFAEAVEMVRGQETVSISQLQRRFRIGYNRAARLIDDMEAQGIVSGQDGSKPRQVLIGELD